MRRPEDLEFSRGPKGKPEVAGPQEALSGSGLHFNASNTRGLQGKPVRFGALPAVLAGSSLHFNASDTRPARQVPMHVFAAKGKPGDHASSACACNQQWHQPQLDSTRNRVRPNPRDRSFERFDAGCAVSCGSLVGLDIESDERLTRRNPLALARRHFSPQELASLQGAGRHTNEHDAAKHAMQKKDAALLAHSCGVSSDAFASMIQQMSMPLPAEQHSPHKAQCPLRRHCRRGRAAAALPAVVDAEGGICEGHGAWHSGSAGPAVLHDVNQRQLLRQRGSAGQAWRVCCGGWQWRFTSAASNQLRIKDGARARAGLAVLSAAAKAGFHGRAVPAVLET